MRESRNQTILIVDSLNQISVSRKQLLKKNGYEISIARSEKETITRIKERSDIDLALTAIDLRENPKSLLVLGEILKKRNIPLVLISDHKDSDIRERMESVTHYGFIPIDSGDFAFLSTLKTAIDFANTKKELAEHKEFQHKILASQRIILDNAAAGIFVVHKGMILLANRKVPEISGYSMEELLSGELFEFIHPDDREMVKKYHYREEDKVEESHTLTCRIILKTGEIRWVEFYFTGIEWEHKRADLCLAYDVTEHKKIEEDHRLKSMILEQIKDYVTITNLEGQITYVNEAEAKMLGLSRDQIIGEKTDVYGEDDIRGATQKEILDIAIKKGSWRGEVINFGKDGQEHILDCRIQTIKNSDGELIALCGISTEVTAQRRFEKTLRESEERFRFLVNHSTDLIWMMQNDGVFSYASPSFKAILGYEPSEIVNEAYQHFIHPADLSVCENYLARITEAKKALPGPQYRVKHADGSWQWHEGNVTPVFADDGSFLYFVGVSRDITDRKQAEDALKESEARFSAFMDNIPITTFIKDKEHRIIYINNEMNKTFSASDWIGKTPHDILPEKIAQKLIDADNRSFEQGYGINEHKIPDKSGRERTWETHVFRIDRENQEPRIGGFSLDITARKQAVEKLKYQRWTYEQVLEQSLAGYWDWMLQEGTEYLSPTLKKMFGYEDHELPNSPETWQKLIFKDDLPRVLDTYNKHVESKGKTPFYNEIRYRHKDGSTVWVICTGRVIEWDSKGEAVRMIGCHINITDRKKKEEELVNAAQEWQKTFNATKDVVWISDKDNRILRSNKAIESILGLTPEESIGKKCWELVHRTNEPISACPNERTKQSLDRETMELVMDNQWLEVSVDPIVDDKGNYNGAVHIITNITTRKEIEEALRLSEERYRMFTQLASDYVFIIGVENDSTKVIWTSDSMRDALKYSNEELTKFSDPFFLIHEEDKMIAKEILEHSLEGKKINRELRLVSKNGKVLWLDVYTEPIIDNNHKAFVKVYGAARDITEEKELFHQLFQAQKLESIGRLAGGVAHDFNNMLGVIIGNADMAIRKISKEHEIKSQLEDILKAADRSAELTRQLLAFARKQAIKPKVINLNVEIKQTLKLIKRLIVEGIELEFKMGKDLWLIKIDPVQIGQILTNLCVNAQDAIKETGKITLETKNVSFDKDFCLNHPDYEKGNYVLLSVSDTGSGMDKETLSRIFEPFYTTKEVGKGTGMGLATVYGIIKQNNGIVEPYSEIGKGTVFRIYFPRHTKVDEPDQEDETQTTLKKGNETVLLVEDDPHLLEIVMTMLKGLGYNVINASKPSEALKAANDYQGVVHLLLSDVVIPEMNGRALADAIQKSRPNIKVIYMSGYTSNVITHHCILDEGTNFIQKPFTLRSIADLIRIVLDK